ncbi:2,3-bisphosphoglycerate-independent phosphoglycerate mutase [Desulfofustis limnaeus]|uniref:2,3-bisphosphoglycerate-independent phosphoglycerate mutase n=1 Tax=Desulfofustis limnaeus TaxID=2740163 RepID=A0ABM7W956_9BACT|nr:2,3-bisphosphoglycerate-independent phosphoglycerate mutase [Desulfofustis limnaeus]BDD87433.1 putative 2,3-bisphosphoglycerate-independent phosphoglycerate mutase [Desulfofustis limnaeus]
MADYNLRQLPGYKPSPGPVVTVIMDGIGLGGGDSSDGVRVAYTPVLDRLLTEPLMTTLKAHGVAVGLPSDDDMGNSEVGHNALGAGRVFSQGAKLVNEAFASGSLFKGAAWRQIDERCRRGGTLHLIGLVSDGNVHSHITHLYRLLEQSREDGFGRVRIHGLLDGRDVGQKSALDYFQPLEQRCRELSRTGYDCCIASGGGRMVTTMDRYEADWSVVRRGWQAHVLGRGRQFGSAVEAIETSYREDPSLTDQYMDAFVVADNGRPVGTIEDGDAVILFNFRGDRAIELSRAFEESDFQAFDRERVPDVFFAGMMEYDGDAKIPANFLVEPPAIQGTLGSYLCASGVSSLAVSETQKFGHVTYFWNGNRTGYIDNSLENYVEIESDRIAFDLRPWMKAAEITDQAVAAVISGKYRFIRLNYPNGDMVGHTGVEAAIRIAVETVDLCLGRLLAAVEKARGIAVITADHGNADCMWTEKNGRRTPMVAHTRNPVPFIVKDFGSGNEFALNPLERRGLTNVAATLCLLLGYQPPAQYDPPLLRLRN